MHLHKTKHKDLRVKSLTTAKSVRHITGWHKLANAIIIQAAADYRKYPKKRADIGKWFGSVWAGVLSRGTATYIHDRLKKEPDGTGTDRRYYKKKTRGENDLL